MNGKVWTERGYSWFELRYLIAFLRKNKFGDLSEIDIKAIFTRREAKLESWTIRRTHIYVWGVPAFDVPDAPELKTEEGSVL